MKRELTEAEKNYFEMLPSHGEVIVCNGFALVLTSVDLEKRGGTYKFFSNPAMAVDWLHEGSKEQFPEWHNKNNCNHASCKDVEGTKFDHWTDLI